MSANRQIAIDEVVADILSKGTAPYEPRLGDRSILAGIGSKSLFLTRDQALARPIRSITLDWLAWELAIAAQRSFYDARQALVNAIPEGNEAVLDGGDGFIGPFDLAAFALGVDPYRISLRPERLHS